MPSNVTGTDGRELVCTKAIQRIDKQSPLNKPACRRGAGQSCEISSSTCRFRPHCMLSFQTNSSYVRVGSWQCCFYSIRLFSQAKNSYSNPLFLFHLRSQSSRCRESAVSARVHAHLDPQGLCQRLRGRPRFSRLLLRSLC